MLARRLSPISIWHLGKVDKELVCRPEDSRTAKLGIGKETKAETRGGRKGGRKRVMMGFIVC